MRQLQAVPVLWLGKDEENSGSAAANVDRADTSFGEILRQRSYYLLCLLMMTALRSRKVMVNNEALASLPEAE